MISSDNGLVPNQHQAIIWTNVDTLHWHIYVPLGLNELIVFGQVEGGQLSDFKACNKDKFISMFSELM